MVLYWLLAPAVFLALISVTSVLGAIALSKMKKSPLPPGLLRWSALELVPLIGLVALLSLPAILNAGRSHKAAFEEVFGSSALPGISGLKSRTDSGADYREIFLAFDRNQAGQRAIRKAFANSGTSRESDWVASMAIGDLVPPWWKGAPVGYGEITCVEGLRTEYRNWGGWQSVAVVECQSDGRIYVAVGNID